MGSLILPDGGLVYFDANALIYSVERIAPFGSLLETAWRSARDGLVEIVSSELVYLECVARPVRDRDTLLIQIYRDLFLDTRDVRLLPVRFDVIERATAIRAETGLKTPDAIHAATALDERVAMFVTNDRTFRRVNGLPVVVLSELV